MIIFTQRTKCRTEQEICLHTRAPKNPAEGLGPMAVFCSNAAEDLECMTVSSVSPHQCPTQSVSGFEDYTCAPHTWLPPSWTSKPTPGTQTQGTRILSLCPLSDICLLESQDASQMQPRRVKLGGQKQVPPCSFLWEYQCISALHATHVQTTPRRAPVQPQTPGLDQEY